MVTIKNFDVIIDYSEYVIYTPLVPLFLEGRLVVVARAGDQSARLKMWQRDYLIHFGEFIMNGQKKLKLLLCPGYIRGVYIIRELLGGPSSEICEVVGAMPDNRRRNGKHRFWQYLADEDKEKAEKMVLDPLNEAGIPVCSERAGTDEAFDFVSKYRADIAVLANFGDIVPLRIINQFKLGMYNTHASDLPKYAGGRPYEDAINAGETDFWVSLHEVDEGVDTGHVMMKIGPLPIFTDAKPMDLYRIGIWPTLFLIRNFLMQVYKSQDTFRNVDTRREFFKVVS